MSKAKNKTSLDNIDFEKLFRNLKLIVVQPLIEVFQGVKAKHIPLESCLIGSLLLMGLVGLNLDFLVVKKLDMNSFYPSGIAWGIYKVLVVTSPFYFWGVFQTGLRMKVIRKLTKVFTEAGLKSVLNRLPAYVSDVPLDSDSRKLTIKLKGQTLKQIQDHKDHIQEALRVHIDEIKSDRAKGIVDLIYSYEELENNFSIQSFDVQERNFLIGKSRTNTLYGDLADIPHLLVAGQTGMGKSTFLRQFITSLYLKNKNYTFELIDLKQGLEFQIFHDLPRVTVNASVLASIKILERLASMVIEERSKLFLYNDCKDIDTFLKLKKEDRKFPKGVDQNLSLNRHIVVIDEAFDLFMKGIATVEEVARSRKAASKIAAQGRAVGIHLIIATQRPDRYAVDPQTKANLTGKVCFRVANIATSNTILDSKIAAELPNIKGRAIWQSTKDMKQIQTPNLTETQAKELLKKFYTNKSGNNFDPADEQ